MLRCDLHTHTSYSDGTKSPQELIKLAQERGIRILGITDHDEIAGIEEAIEFASKVGIEIIPGIELSAIYHGIDVHILGYMIDYRSQELKNFLKYVKNIREKRAYRIVEKLKRFNINIPIDILKKHAGYGAIGRPHIARAMKELGYVNDVSEAFDKYIGYDKPAYVPKFKLSIQEAIDLVHKYGGIAILAHPDLIKDRKDEIIQKTLEWKIDGFEIWHPDIVPETREYLLKLAENHHLVLTGGSDFHGENKIGYELGTPVLYCKIKDKEIKVECHD